MLSKETWHNRLSLLFDIFKCSGNDEIAYDDILLGCQIIFVSLHKLWDCSELDHSKWNSVIGIVTDGAYSKVN